MSLLPENRISILLVDDHELIRAGISRLIADETDMQVVAEVSSGEAALQYVENARPSIVLMESGMNGIGGIETTRQLLSKISNIHIIAMSSVNTGVIPAQILRAGARGFITKRASTQEMLKAIRLVAEGNRYITPQVAVQLAMDPFNRNEKLMFDKLSRREMQIAHMLTDGNKVSKISEYLKLSPKTVYSYRYRIFEKLGIRSDVELTILAMKHGLAEDSGEFDDLSALAQIAG